MIKSKEVFTEKEIGALLAHAESSGDFVVDRTFSLEKRVSWAEVKLNKKKHAELLTKQSLLAAPLTSEFEISFTSDKVVPLTKKEYIFETLNSARELYANYGPKFSAFCCVAITVALDPSAKYTAKGDEVNSVPNFTIAVYFDTSNLDGPNGLTVMTVWYSRGDLKEDPTSYTKYTDSIKKWLETDSHWKEKKGEFDLFCFKKRGDLVSDDFSEVERFLEIMGSPKILLSSGCITGSGMNNYQAKSEFVFDAMERFDKLGLPNYKVEMCVDVAEIDPGIHDVANSFIRHKKVKVPVATLCSEDDRVSFEVFKVSDGEGAYHLYIDDSKHYGVVPSCFKHIKFTD